VTHLAGFVKRSATGLAQLLEIIPVASVLNQVQHVVEREAEPLREARRPKVYVLPRLTRQRGVGQEAMW